MRALLHLLSVAVVLLCAGIPAATQAQTPLPKVAPRPTMRWLDSLTVDPTPVAQDGLQSVTATLKLIRPAASTMKVDLELAGGTPARGNPGMQRVKCAWTFWSIHMEPRTSRESFPIYTGSLQPRAGSPPTMVPTVITIAARYGSERASATFTVNCPQ